MTTLIDQELHKLYELQDADAAFTHLRRRGAATQLVPGDGSLRPRAIFIGEAPGRQEDLKGSPFVGPSGKLLDKLFRPANLSRDEVWITNVVKFRPPRNRTPTEEEISASLPYLKRELALVGRSGCRTLVGLGRTACEAITGRSLSPLGKHGTWWTLRNSWNLYITCHPSWGLRSEPNRDVLLDDFLQLGYDLGTVNNEE